MKHHRPVFGVGPEAGFDEERFVITNAYTGGSDGLKKTFDAATKHRDETYNSFCAQQLDYERGDDVLQIGQMTMKTARAYLTDSVPRDSLAALLLAGFAVALQIVVLPLMHWFDASRQWNQLRPSIK
jgi:hypothetical protein